MDKETTKAKGGPRYLLMISILLLAQAAVFSIEKSNEQTALSRAPRPDLVPMEFSDWEGRSRGLDEISREMLRPDAYLVRDYASRRGWVLNLTVIYGRRRTSIHSPALCLLGGGWNTLAKSQVTLVVGKDEIEMTRLLLQKGERRTVVFYSFLSPAENTASWATFQTRMLESRLLGREARGALLRLVVPVRISEEEADRAAQAFLEETYPKVRQAFDL